MRLLLDAHGQVEAHSKFVRFKTTHHTHYDAFTPADTDVFDTVLWNTQREITECTRANIALQPQGQWVTPTLRCGLLPSVGRAVALQEGRVSEAVMRLGKRAWTAPTETQLLSL